MSLPFQSRMHCSVPECKSHGSEPDVTLFSFPKSRKYQKLWKGATKIEETISRIVTVCNKHFVASDFLTSSSLTTRGQNKLLRIKRNVVPSRHLPGQLMVSLPLISNGALDSSDADGDSSALSLLDDDKDVSSDINVSVDVDDAPKIDDDLVQDEMELLANGEIKPPSDKDLPLNVSKAPVEPDPPQERERTLRFEPSDFAPNNEATDPSLEQNNSLGSMPIDDLPFEPTIPATTLEQDIQLIDNQMSSMASDPTLSEPVPTEELPIKADSDPCLEQNMPLAEPLSVDESDPLPPLDEKLPLVIDNDICFEPVPPEEVELKDSVEDQNGNSEILSENNSVIDPVPESTDSLDQDKLLTPNKPKSDAFTLIIDPEPSVLDQNLLMDTLSESSAHQLPQVDLDSEPVVQNGPVLNGHSEPSEIDDFEPVQLSRPLKRRFSQTINDEQEESSEPADQKRPSKRRRSDSLIDEQPKTDLSEPLDKSKPLVNGLSESLDEDQSQTDGSEHDKEILSSEPLVNGSTEIIIDDATEPADENPPLVNGVSECLDEVHQTQVDLSESDDDESTLSDESLVNQIIDDGESADENPPLKVRRSESSIDESTQTAPSEPLIPVTEPPQLDPPPDPPATITTPPTIRLIDQESQTGPFEGPIPINFLDNLEAYDYQLTCFAGITRPTLDMFAKAVCDYTKLEPSRAIIRRIIVTMVKLRTNLSFQCLSILFHQDLPSCKLIFTETINVLGAALKASVCWPSKKEIFASLPFTKSSSNTSLMLESLEIFIERAPNVSKVKTYTDRQLNRDTSVKLLVGFTPAGLISYVSPVYGGESSEEAIFLKENVLSNLDPFDAILVNSGFHVEDVCDKKCVTLLRAPVASDRMNTRELELIAQYETMKGYVTKTLENLRCFNVFSCRISKELVMYMGNAAIVVAAAVNAELKLKRSIC